MHSLIILAVGLLVSSTIGAEQEATLKRPNVLFIAVDDLRPELGCYGSEAVKSPNIDRLANSGVTFTSAYCQQAVCNPSRASLLTGLRPDTICVWDLPTHFRAKRPDTVTLPQCFLQQGYHTAVIGKIFHHNLTLMDPVSWSEPRLDTPDADKRKMFYPGVEYLDPKTQARVDRIFQGLLDEGQTREYVHLLGHRHIKLKATECSDVPDNAYFDGAQTDVAVAKLAELKRQGKPFFFGVGYHKPHLPFTAPKKYWDMYDRDRIPLAENDFLPKGAPPMAMSTMRELRDYEDMSDLPETSEGPVSADRARLLRHGYLACVSYVDAQIGRLLDELEKLDLDDDTIVVLWGDHGWKLGEHRGWCKMTNYEIDTRVPLIVRVPGAKGNGKPCGRLVEFVDIYPTLCDLAGLDAPAELEGTSFVSLLDDCDRPWKKAAFSQFLRTDKWMGSEGIPYMGYAIRTPEWRYVEWYRWDAENATCRELVGRELYDERKDPDENVNLIDSPEHQATIETLAEQLKSGWKAARP
ncbi:MAG TPA: iduronate sulfatase [Planctomycetaceae bacterium]|nr:iduronate sulfatase [Planctomycetaceae bacterium]